MELPTITEGQRSSMDPSLLDPIEYRKSGLSLNHIVGCPLDCAYCVRHLFQNFGMKQPHSLMSDKEAVERLVTHLYFQAGITPIQIFNRATDPFVSSVKPHTFSVLENLARRGLSNHVLVITRYKVTEEDCDRLNQLSPLKVTLLLTHSGISDPRIEPIASEIAASSLRLAYSRAWRYRTVLYWRPIVPGLNDSETDLARVVELSHHAHATVFTGLFFRHQIRDYFQANGLPELYDQVARRKIFPEELEGRILSYFEKAGRHDVLFRKTSCAVSFAHSLPDYNGHYGIQELCDICPSAQVERCRKAWVRPDETAVGAVASRLGVTKPPVFDGRAILTAGLDEQPRYFIQHSFGYQVHDEKHPHAFRRHGRAEIGWNTPKST